MICGILAALTACGQGESDAALAQNITAGAGSQEDAGKGGDGESGENGEEQEQEAPDQEGKKEEEGVFGFSYGGVTLVPGEVFDESSLEKHSGVSEVPSCAFEGNDRVYNYKKFELTANIEEDGEHIYSIYLIDPNLTTTEGLGFGDSVEDMKSLYGEDFELEGTAYAYIRGNTMLSIVTQNDSVVGIEYRLDK